MTTWVKIAEVMLGKFVFPAAGVNVAVMLCAPATSMVSVQLGMVPVAVTASFEQTGFAVDRESE